jgi:transcription elongation factor GreB
MSAPIYTTPGGYKRLLGRIREVRDRYDRVCATNEEAAGAGDSSVWHDNFAFEENQRQMHQLAWHLRELQRAAASAQVAQPPRDPDRVCLGVAVRIREQGDTSSRRVVIAGWQDGDPERGRVAYDAPLAKALLGAELGDVRAVPKGKTTSRVEILSIEMPEEEEL